jgi:outer membrane protein assembly factor BamB
MVIIDLGVMSEEPPEPPPRRVPPRSRRIVALLACLVLAGGLLAASGPAGDGVPPGVRVPSVDTDSYFVDGDRLYVVEGAGTSESQSLVAYTAPGGERLWQQTMEPRLAAVGVRDLGEVVLVVLRGGENDQRSVALEPDTGETRWSHDGGWPMATGAGTAVFGRENGEPDTPVLWEAVRITDGERLWWHEFPPLSYGAPLTEGSGLVLMTLPDQTIQVWDMIAHRMVSSARPPDGAGISVDADRALAIVARLGRTDVVAYALPGLERLWEREFTSGLQLSMCGPEVLCAGPDAQDSVRVLDPGTGEVLWENAAYSWMIRAGPVLLGAGTQGPGASTGTGPLLAADVRTGRLIKDFGRWELIDLGPLRHDDDTVVVADFDSETATAIIAELDLTAMTLRVLVQARDIDRDCYSRRDVLVCRFLGGGVGMWDLRVAR